MRPLNDINPCPLRAYVSQSKRVIKWRVGNRCGRVPITNPKPSAIAAQLRDLAVKFNTQEIVV